MEFRLNYREKLVFEHAKHVFSFVFQTLLFLFLTTLLLREFYNNLYIINCFTYLSNFNDWLMILSHSAWETSPLNLWPLIKKVGVPGAFKAKPSRASSKAISLYFLAVRQLLNWTIFKPDCWAIFCKSALEKLPLALKNKRSCIVQNLSCSKAHKEAWATAKEFSFIMGYCL